MDWAALQSTSETASDLTGLVLSVHLRQSSSAAMPSKVSMCLSKQCSSSSLQCFSSSSQRRCPAAEGLFRASLMRRTKVLRNGSIIIIIYRKCVRCAGFHDFLNSVLAENIYVRLGVVCLGSLELTWCVGSSLIIFFVPLGFQFCKFRIILLRGRCQNNQFLAIPQQHENNHFLFLDIRKYLREKYFFFIRQQVLNMRWGMVLAKAVGKGLLKGIAKIGLKAIALPLVVVVQATEAAICVVQGDFVGAGICVVSGIVDVATCGAASAIIQTAEQVSVAAAKEASIQATKQAVKEGGKQIGKSTAKQIAKGGCKQILVQQAKQAFKELSRQSGKQLSKNLASGAISNAAKQVFKETSKTALKGTTVAISGQIVRSSLQGTIQEGLKSLTQAVVQIGVTSAEEILKQQAKGVGKEIISSTIKNTITEAVKQIGEQASKDALKEVSKGEIIKTIGKILINAKPI